MNRKHGDQNKEDEIRDHDNEVRNNRRKIRRVQDEAWREAEQKISAANRASREKNAEPLPMSKTETVRQTSDPLVDSEAEKQDLRVDYDTWRKTAQNPDVVRTTCQRVDGGTLQTEPEAVQACQRVDCGTLQTEPEAVQACQQDPRVDYGRRETVGEVVRKWQQDPRVEYGAWRQTTRHVLRKCQQDPLVYCVCRETERNHQVLDAVACI
jgi:hypothetical protein